MKYMPTQDNTQDNTTELDLPGATQETPTGETKVPRIEDIDGLFEANSGVPTHYPKKIIDQIVPYFAGTTYRLYWYIKDSWKTFYDSTWGALTAAQVTDLTDGGTTTLHSHATTPTTYLDYRFPDDLRGATMKTLTAQYTVPANKRFYLQRVQLIGAGAYTVTIDGKSFLKNSYSGYWPQILANPAIVGAGIVVDSNQWSNGTSNGCLVFGIEIANPDTGITPIYETITEAITYTVPANKDLILLNTFVSIAASSGLYINTYRMFTEGINDIGLYNGVSDMMAQPLILPTGTTLTPFTGAARTAYIFGYLKANS